MQSCWSKRRSAIPLLRLSDAAMLSPKTRPFPGCRSTRHPSVTRCAACFSARSEIALLCPSCQRGSEGPNTSLVRGSCVEWELDSLRFRHRKPKPRTWMDLTQFNANPYFIDLLPGHFSFRNGFWETTLRAQELARNRLVKRGALPRAALRIVESIFLTDPPVKALDI